MSRIFHFRTLRCPNSFVFMVLTGTLLAALGCSESKEKRPSPLRIDSIQSGGNLLRIEYSSPRVRGRKIFGSGEDALVQYDEMWRTGANEATVFSTDQDIRIDTFDVPKGKYALFTIPGESTWRIMLNKEWNQWGSYHYKDSLDVVQMVVQVEKLDSSNEDMEFYFEENALKFRWEKVGWSIPIN